MARAHILFGLLTAGLVGVGAVAAPLVGVPHSALNRTSASGAAALPAEAGRGQIVLVRRVGESHYRNTVADIFGDQIKIGGHFDPGRRVGGLLASGETILSVTPSGFDGYVKMADSIADQVFAPDQRARYLACTPTGAANDACTRTFFSKYGELLFRRPLTAAQLDMRMALASRASAAAGEPYAGLRAGLISLLTAPDFLFRIERSGPDGQLDAYSRAARLSGLLWNASPDVALLRAAAAGDLSTSKGLQDQSDRMMASPRFRRGMTEFFDDMLQLDAAKYVSKDPEIYPKFNAEVARSAPEETRRMVIGFLLDDGGDYRDLLTTRKTYINRTLAAVYGVPFSFKGDWAPYEFPESSGRSGLLTQVYLLSTYAHPGRSSPTRRGVALREAFMCQPTPEPPPDVDFSVVNDDKGSLKTLRERLLAHASDDSCASCHTRTDPIGLTLENFDGIGVHRTLDNGQPIDASATLKGKSVVGVQGLAYLLREDPNVSSCLVRNLYAYGSGADGEDIDRAKLSPALTYFAQQGFKLRPIVTYVATSSDFYSLVAPHAPAAHDAKRVVAQR